MQSITELQRKASPATRPMSLAYLNGSLFMGSLDTSTIYEIDPTSWEVRSQTSAPGKPYGMAVLGGAIRVVVSIGEEDDRHLFTLMPGNGFDAAGAIALPDLSGSHLASDGTSLFVLQIGQRQIVTLDESGAVLKKSPLSVRLGGIGCAKGKLYGLAGDEEFEHLHFASVDLSGEKAVTADIASISDEARALTHDGSNWWTSYRDENDIASFSA